MSKERVTVSADWAERIREYLDQRADTVDGESDEMGPSQHPNAAMVLLGELDELLGKAGESL